VIAIEQLENAARVIGYRAEALIRDYLFADVLEEATPTRVAAVVGFTSTPPSYRSAAFAAVEGDGREPRDLAREVRALGAPLLFVVEGDRVGVWQVRSTEPPSLLDQVGVDDLVALFTRNEAQWRPDAIHRAKAVAPEPGRVQLDFVDAGLLIAIEGEIHSKLDRLLTETLDLVRNTRHGRDLDAPTLFRVVFRMLAAKVLQDRGHPHAATWNRSDLRSVLKGIEDYYRLGSLSTAINPLVPLLFAPAWAHLLRGINFSNISSDDLAFIYENTLVTEVARRRLGTHSTPSQLAEYVVRRLDLGRYDPQDLRIYEPFVGAGVFLVSALRNLRALLPADWTDEERHVFLVDRLAGDELDVFACEVATLSLILADYPNHNGWHIGQANLFEDGVLAARMATANVVVCNPPFQAFSTEERTLYPAAAASTHSKAIAALEAALDAEPYALGFVLPRSFLVEQQFERQRARIAELYADIELVKLPDRIFGASHTESAAIIARKRRDGDVGPARICCTEVAERDRHRFLKTGHVTVTREETRPFDVARTGELWIPSLAPVWHWCTSYPKLGELLSVTRGLEWNYAQDEAYSMVEKPGYRPGYARAEQLEQFTPPQPVWLDFCRDHIRCAAGHDWDGPKLVANAVRISRAGWCLATSLDTDAMLCSQQFFALRPRGDLPIATLKALVAVLNGPVVNAYIAVHSPKRGLRAEVVARAPLPPILPTSLGPLIDELTSLLRAPDEPQAALDALDLLDRIDAEVTGAYELPYRLERSLLDYFAGARRSLALPWQHWDDRYPGAGLSLSERVAQGPGASHNWAAAVFRPLPEPELALFRAYIG
jgi:hypothetical protein